MHPFPAIFPRLPLLPDSSPATSCLRNVTGAPLPEPILSSSLSRVVSIRSSSPESLPMRGSSPRRDRVPASALALSSSKTPAPVRMVNSIVSHARRYCLGSVACAPPMRSSPHLPNTKNQLDPLVWQITAVAVLGSLMGQVDATVVNVSLSSLAVDLHCSLTTIQWVTSGYLLALALMLPLNGWLVGQLGAKSLYLWCFPIFTLSSALCGLAWSANSLIGFRVLQGMSGGLMAPLAQMMIVRAAGRHTARVFGYAAVPILLGPLLGPVACWGDSSTCFLALAVPGERSSRSFGNPSGDSLSSRRPCRSPAERSRRCRLLPAFPGPRALSLRYGPCQRTDRLDGIFGCPGAAHGLHPGGNQEGRRCAH